MERTGRLDDLYSYGHGPAWKAWYSKTVARRFVEGMVLFVKHSPLVCYLFMEAKSEVLSTRIPD